MRRLALAMQGGKVTWFSEAAAAVARAAMPEDVIPHKSAETEGAIPMSIRSTSLIGAAILLVALGGCHQEESDPSWDAFVRGVDLAAEGEWESAILAYTESIQLNPDAVSAYFNRGLAYDSLERLDDALAD